MNEPDRSSACVLGVISDTHGHAEFLLEAMRVLESWQVEAIVHCGDIGAPEFTAHLRQWPAHFVLGNTDPPRADWEASLAPLGHTFHGRFGQLELAGKRIAFLHGDDDKLLRQTIASGEWDLVCHGHTHVAELRRVGKTLVLNPGALYRANPHTLAIVELPALEVTHVPLP